MSSMILLSIDSSSLNDEEIFYVDATNIIAQETLNEPCHGGSIVGHGTMDLKKLWWHYLLYRDYFSDNPIFGLKYFSQMLVYSLKYVCIMFCPRVMVCLNNTICLHRF
jgi:hypothetical protein